LPKELRSKQIHTNPYKDVLKQHYGIRFPTTSNLDCNTFATTRDTQFVNSTPLIAAGHWLTTLPAPQFSSQQEKDDFYYARSQQLQDMRSQHHINTFHQTLGSGFPCARFQIPEAKISWIPDSGFPYMGQHIVTKMQVYQRKPSSSSYRILIFDAFK